MKDWPRPRKATVQWTISAHSSRCAQAELGGIIHSRMLARCCLLLLQIDLLTSDHDMVIWIYSLLVNVSIYFLMVWAAALWCVLAPSRFYLELHATCLGVGASVHVCCMLVNQDAGVRGTRGTFSSNHSYEHQTSVDFLQSITTCCQLLPCFKKLALLSMQL